MIVPRLLVAAALLLAPAPLVAQKAEPCTVIRVTRDTTTARAPLDRRISIRAESVALTNLLDRIAAEAKIRFTYSSAYLPADRRVCVNESSVAVGRLLDAILVGLHLDARVVQNDHVVLTPVVATRQPVVPEPTTEQVLSVQRVEPVVTTAEDKPAPELEVTTSRRSISGADISRQDARTLATMLNGAVPGMWLWQQGQGALFSTFGSLRGASSFGASSPKTYIDGIEVANPLLTTLLDAGNIDRIDIIRGPQGSALFGSDAMSGVVNITTRHEGAPGGGIDLAMRGSAGMVESRYANTPLLAQDHSVTLRAGSAVRSLGLSFNTNRTGAYMPGAESQQITALATARRVGAHSILGATARLAAANAMSADNPLFAGTLDASGATSDSTGRQSINQYTVGLSAQLFPEGRWNHVLSLGVDGYRLRGAAADLLPMSLAVDAALSRTPSVADRASLRASSSVRLLESAHATTTFTLSAEHTSLREVGDQWIVAARDTGRREFGGPAGFTRQQRLEGGGPPPAGADTLPLRTLQSVATTRASTGVAAQMDVAVHERVHFTGGMRIERLLSPDGTTQLVALPMVGGAAARQFGELSLKFRTAYGKGIRAPRTTLEQALGVGQHGRVPDVALVPEQQRGTEAGLELFYGRALQLAITRFDQVASGLVQTISLPTRGGRTMYGLGNVGEIANSGWEIEPRVTHGAVTLSGALAFVDSRVQSVARGYTGDLRPGDRMLGVPAMTAGLSLGVRMGLTDATIGVAHARDWMNYDMLALGESANAETMSGTGLRDYWRSYDGVTQLRASVSRQFARGFDLVLTGENLLGLQLGAPDNATVLPGRTTTLGLRWRF